MRRFLICIQDKVAKEVNIDMGTISDESVRLYMELIIGSIVLLDKSSAI